MLSLRPIDPDDYSVLEDGQAIGRIRLAREQTPEICLWTVTVNIPGPPFGSAGSLAEAKQSFRAGWEAFKTRHGPEALAAAYEAMNHANRPNRR